MFSKWRRKILPKLWMEVSDELAVPVDKGAKRCPFLTPFMLRNANGTVESIPQECMRDRCEIWDPEEGRCSIPVIAKLLRKRGGANGS